MRELKKYRCGSSEYEGDGIFCFEGEDEGERAWLVSRQFRYQPENFSFTEGSSSTSFGSCSSNSFTSKPPSPSSCSGPLFSTSESAMRPRLRLQKRTLPTAEEEGDEATTALPRSAKQGQERRVQMGEEAVGGVGRDGNGGGEQAACEAGRLECEILVKMDSHVLDCTICCESLQPPIYQCEVGHAVCFACRRKLSSTCPFCCRGLSFGRCFALEQVVDTVKVPCSNANYGCKEFIIYHQKEKHEKTCVHVPCFCPEYGCSFKGSTGSLLHHFVSEHKWSPTNFHYDKAQRICIPRHRRFTALVGEDRSMFLMVNTCTDIGNALTTICIKPHESIGSCYSSKISAVCGAKSDNGRYVFQMDPHVSSSSLHDGVQLGSFFLLVPLELLDELADEFTINISIVKIKCALHH